MRRRTPRARTCSVASANVALDFLKESKRSRSPASAPPPMQMSLRDADAAKEPNAATLTGCNECWCAAAKSIRTFERDDVVGRDGRDRRVVRARLQHVRVDRQSLKTPCDVRPRQQYATCMAQRAAWPNRNCDVQHAARARTRRQDRLEYHDAQTCSRAACASRSGALRSPAPSPIPT